MRRRAADFYSSVSKLGACDWAVTRVSRAHTLCLIIATKSPSTNKTTAYHILITGVPPDGNSFLHVETGIERQGVRYSTYSERQGLNYSETATPARAEPRAARGTSRTRT